MYIVNSGPNAIYFYTGEGGCNAYMNTAQFYYYGNIQATGTLIAGGGVSSSSLNTNGGRIDSGAIYSGLINTNSNSITSGSISCSSLNTNNNSITSHTNILFKGIKEKSTTTTNSYD